ncbi:MAG: amidohydrolase [Candidatus Cloacimonetes bacterium]|nr:amidohydrolase [Candidatus Cloacimonadota bacterium]
MKTLFRGGSVWTMNPAQPRAAAVVVEDGRVRYVGDDPGFVPGATVIDLDGRLLLPAFTDTHTHFMEVARLKFDIDLSDCASLNEVRTALIAFRDRWDGRMSWLGGVGWNKNVWPSLEGFDRTFLDDIFGDQPVTFKSKDLHTKWCNTAALRAAGITRHTPDPPGGRIGRDARGEPDGFLGERAWLLLQPFIPPVGHEQLKQAARDTVRQMWPLGLAGVHMMEGEDAWKLFEELADEGQRFRYVFHPPLSMLDELIERGLRSYTSVNQWFDIGGIKLFMDGSIGSQTACMYDPYPDTGDNGYLLMQPDEFERLVNRAADAGLGSAVHAIGDRTVHIVAQALARARRKRPELLQRIEHAQCVHPDDVAVLAREQIYCAMQPIHIAMDTKITPHHWPVAAQYSYPVRTLLNAGVPVGFGSDAPVETINPFHGIYAALRRRYRNDPSEPIWMPHEAVSVEQALAAYTTGAAQGAGAQNRQGRIAAGMAADLIVLDDFTAQPDEFWLGARSRLTMVGGEIVWQDID